MDGTVWVVTDREGNEYSAFLDPDDALEAVGIEPSLFVQSVLNAELASCMIAAGVHSSDCLS